MSENTRDDKYLEFLNSIPPEVRDEIIGLFCLYIEQIADVKSGELPEKCKCCGQFLIKNKSEMTHGA